LVKLISDNLASVLSEQIGHEKYNANLYLFIGAFLKNKGLDHIAQIFETQHKEETEHALIIYKLMTDLNAPVFIPEISRIELSFNSIVDIAEQYLKREILTTQSLNDIKKLAIDEDNPIVEERMRYMLTLQQHEYEEASGFFDKAELLGDDWLEALYWDMALK
jgi:ferritin